MARVSAFAKLKTNAARFVRPNIRNYNRLEGNPRSTDFERALSMETNDPMWFLCRQWQFGEFEGEDAGTAAEAQVLGHDAAVEEITIGGVRSDFDDDYPLEAQVEREPIAPTYWIRVQAGRQFASILEDRSLKRYVRTFAELLPVPTDIADDDEDARLLALAIGDSVPDGYQVIEHVEQDTWSTFVNAEADAADRAALREAAAALYDWFYFLYFQPEGAGPHWQPDRLEYSVSLAARRAGAGVRELNAREYASGELDWKDFDQRQIPNRGGTSRFSPARETVQTFLPAPLRFSGMPHPRLWQLEDGEVNFGKLNASPTSLLNVLLAEYGLNYSNDWFILPWEMRTNTVSEIQGILIRDVFGIYQWVAPAIDDPETDWQTFAMFHQTEVPNRTKGKSAFFLPPVVGQRLEGDDLELVSFMRDEMSNLVWAIEAIVEGGTGNGRRLKREVPSLADFEPVGEDAEVRYVLGNTVPENWIPFVAAHKQVPGSGVSREIRLQRARMPAARGAIGRILTEEQPTYFIEEEEVPRSGVLVSRRYQRTRWRNGTTVLWVGRKKAVGRGEGSASLAFDSLLPIDL